MASLDAGASTAPAPRTAKPAAKMSATPRGTAATWRKTSPGAGELTSNCLGIFAGSFGSASSAGRQATTSTTSGGGGGVTATIGGGAAGTLAAAAAAFPAMYARAEHIPMAATRRNKTAPICRGPATSSNPCCSRVSIPVKSASVTRKIRL